MPDNLKTGVIKADLYDPLLNRSYAELAAHYLLTELTDASWLVRGGVSRQGMASAWC